MSRDKAVLLVISREISILREMTDSLDKAVFVKTEKDQCAIIMTLLNIGEKVKQLTPAFRNRHNAIKWKQISGLRDIVAHSYYKLDMDDIWNTVKISIPEFEKQLNELLAHL
jgi:uncharacterized protein with HEPN domain